MEGQNELDKCNFLNKRHVTTLLLRQYIDPGRGDRLFRSLAQKINIPVSTLHRALKVGALHFLLLAFHFPFKDRDVRVGVTIRVLVGVGTPLFNGCLVSETASAWAFFNSPWAFLAVW
jgi:hypothetical protein